MVKTKTGITLLKRLGFVLIALPEPFTTPIGVACILASSYLSRLREATLNKHLRETLTRYLSHSKSSNHETENNSRGRHKVKRHTRIDDPTILWQNKSVLPVETSHPPSVRQNLRDKGFTLSTIEGENTIHHNVDTESLSRRYPVTVSPKAENVSAHSDAEPAKIEKLIHHSVDTKFLSRRYPVTASSKAKTGSPHSDVEPDETEELIHHSVDMQTLGRRYRADDSSRVASDVPDKPSATENVVHHTKHISLSRRYPETVSAKTDSNKALTPDTDEIVEHHSINLKLLSQRYGHLTPAR